MPAGFRALSDDGIDPGRFHRQRGQGLLDQEPIVARQILRKLLVGRIAFTPRPEAPTPHYEFTGQVAYGRLLSGVVWAKGMVPPG